MPEGDGGYILTAGRVQNTSPLLGLHARTDSVHAKMRTQSTQKIAWEGDKQTLQLLERIGLRADSLKMSETSDKKFLTTN